MIQKFVEAWDVNKSKLEEHLKTHRMEEYDEYDKLAHQIDEKYLNERILVTRKDGSVREVEIMLDKSTGKYAFVNLTTHHVCPCRFDTIKDAVDDMRNDDFVVDFKLKDE